MDYQMVQGVKASYPKGMMFNSGVDELGAWDELVATIVAQELHIYKNQNKELASVDITLDAEGYLVVSSKEKSPVRRVRRITGYLSNQENFSDAKHDELLARVDHTESHKRNYLREV